MSSSKIYPWDLILKLIGQNKHIEEGLINRIKESIDIIFEDEKKDTYIFKDAEKLASYNKFIKDCIAASHINDKYHVVCQELFPKKIIPKKLEGIDLVKSFLEEGYILQVIYESYKETGSIQNMKPIDTLERIIQHMKLLLEENGIAELISGYMYQVKSLSKNEEIDEDDLSGEFFGLYYYLIENMSSIERMIASLRTQEALANASARALLSKEEAEEAAAAAKAGRARAEKAKKEFNASVKAAALAKARMEEAIAALAEAEYKALMKQQAAEAVGAVIQPNPQAVEEERAAREAQKIANIEAERQAYLNRLPNYVPRTNQSNWQRITGKISTPAGKVYKADYHEEGICEINFQTLAEKLSEHIKSAHYYSAFLQLERCIQEREKAFNEKGNKNKNHESILRGLEHLLQRMKDAPIDKIETIKFENNSFFRITTVNNTYEDIQIFRGGKRQTKKQKKRNHRKTRKY